MSENYKLTIMKELSIEEKAKAYDEAIEKAKIWQEHLYDVNDKDYADELNYIFPELKESEDEKIRNQIIEHIKWCEDGGYCAKEEMTRWISWLEKQGEQKSAWSEEDETTKNNISHIIRQYDKISKRENQPCWYVGDCLLWMQSIKDRVQPQSQQQWSEEDDSCIQIIIQDLERIVENKNAPKEQIIDVLYNEIKWLKNRLESLKDRVQPQRKEWSKEDDTIVSYITLNCMNYADKMGYVDEKQNRELHKMAKDWLISIKNRVHTQPKQEWSEEDENMLTDTEYLMRVVKMENRSDNEYQRAENCINWLKSLRLQSQWKPSDEQMNNK